MSRKATASRAIIESDVLLEYDEATTAFYHGKAWKRIDFALAIANSVGTNAAIARWLGVREATVRKFMRADPVLRDLQAWKRSEMLEKAEQAIDEALSQRDDPYLRTKTAMWLLENRGGELGYGKGQEPTDNEIVIEYVNDWRTNGTQGSEAAESPSRLENRAGGQPAEPVRLLGSGSPLAQDDGGDAAGSERGAE